MMRTPSLVTLVADNCFRNSVPKLSLRGGRRLPSSAVRCYSVKPASTVDNIISSPFSDVALPECTLPQFIWKGLDVWSDKTAVECGITGKAYTYTQLRTISLRLGSSMLKMGLKPGDVVTVILPNIPEFPVTVLGIMEAGLTVSTINPIYTAEEISLQIKDSESKCVITHPSIVPIVIAAKAKLQSKLPVICLGENNSSPIPSGSISFYDLVQDSIDTSNVSTLSQRINIDETSYLPYSSGTTGLPKGVCLTHRTITANLAQISHPDVAQIRMSTKESQDTIPAILPFFHIYGSTVVMLQSLLKGAKLVTLPKFEPQPFLNILKNNKDIVLHVVPPMVLFLGVHPSVTKQHLEPIRSAISGGAPCGASDIERVLKRKEFSLVQAYGMTEASPVLTYPENKCTNKQTIGAPLSMTQAKVVELGTGKALPSGENGELCFKGPQVMKKYHKRPDATAETIDKDGWLHTGDIGYYDENGYLFIVDRIKELIKVKGFQVPPAEIEAVLRQYPHICDAGVIGMPCSRAGEKPIAFVVTKDGSPTISPTSVQKFVAERVASYKQIAKVIVTDMIPKNASGKILRRQLRDMANKIIKEE